MLIGTANHRVLVLSEDSDSDSGPAADESLHDRLLPLPSAVVSMAVSPNGLFVACYRRDGVLTVFSHSFTTKVQMNRQLDR